MREKYTRALGFLGRLFGPMFVFLMATTPISDVAVKLGFAKLVKPLASKMSYETPDITEIGAFVAEDAAAVPSGVSTS